jgi:putative membrane protein
VSRSFDLEDTVDRSDVRLADALANERTFLAYVRTALAFIAFGFVIARFSLFTREFSELVHQTLPTKGLSVAFGTVMALFGAAIGALGGWRYASTERGLRRGANVALSSSAGYLISLFVAIIGLIVACALFSP